MKPGSDARETKVEGKERAEDDVRVILELNCSWLDGCVEDDAVPRVAEEAAFALTGTTVVFLCVLLTTKMKFRNVSAI